MSDAETELEPKATPAASGGKAKPEPAAKAQAPRAQPPGPRPTVARGQKIEPVTHALRPAPRPTKPMKIQLGAFELRKAGAERYDLKDPYHILVTATWRTFLVGLVIAYALINLVFATLYYVSPGSVANIPPGSFAHCFFFSVETFATVGYGVMAPSSLYGHAVSSLEIVCGMAFTAIATGLIIIRFSRPRARVLYADKAVVAIRNGKPTLMLRIGNGRMTVLTNARAQLSALLREETLEGVVYRRPRDLKLDRPHLPIFALTWTLMHELDEASPLYGFDAEKMQEDQVRLFLSFHAHDPALNADVQDMKDYGPDTVAFQSRYQDAISFDEDGRTFADLTRISLIEDDVY